MINRKKTVICDIDGTLIGHYTKPFDVFKADPVLLPGVRDRMNEWDLKCYNIILLTGRKESMRKQTEAQLADLGIFYDQLVMGVGGGQRILINDLKPDPSDPANPTAIAINIERNKGLKGVEI